jgi:MFS family permease
MPLFMRRSQQPAEAEESASGKTSEGWGHRRRPHGSIGFELVNGLRYIISSPILLTLLVMGLVPSLIGMNYQTFLPVFAKEVFGDGVTRNAQALGLMMTMTGVGALAGSLVVASMADYPRRTQLQLVAGLAFGLSLAFFSVQNSFGLALVGLTAVGFCATFFQALNSTMIMSSSHPDYYGRVMSVNMMTFALMPLGGLPIGLLADIIPAMTLGPFTLIGLQTTQLGAGLLVAVFILMVTLRNPAYRRLEQDDFKRFAVIASERLEADDTHGSSWKQLRHAFRQERGSQVGRKLASEADATRVE